MKRKLVLCLLLVVALSLTGCNWFRQPDPGNQPNSPEQQRPPTEEPQLPQFDVPGDNNRRQGQPTASDITESVQQISGVNNAVAIVLGNMAMVGIEAQDGNNALEIETQVSEQIETNFSDIDTVYVTSEPDMTDQISSVADRIARGQPVSELMDEIHDIWQNIRPQ